MAVNIVAVLPRAGAIGIAVVLLMVSAATIGLINSIDSIQFIRENDGPTTGALAAQRALILATQDSAGWLIAKSIVIIIVEVAAIVLIIGIIINLQPKVKLIVEILEVIFCVCVILSYFGTGIACAVYAAEWGSFCDDNYAGNTCETTPLTATTALQAVFCFIQIGVFGVIVVLTILGIVRSRSESKA